MSSTSMDEGEPIVSQLSDENNENYVETCDNAVNDIVPRLERLSINDNGPIYLPSNNMNTPHSSMSIVPSSVNNFEDASMNGSSEKVTSVFGNDASGMISADVDIEVAVGSQISPFGSKEISQVFPTNTQVDINSQELIQKASGDGEIHTHLMDTKEENILTMHKEQKGIGVKSIFDEKPLDLSLKRNFDSNNAANLSSAVSENKNNLSSLMVAPEKMDHTDPETGEKAEHSSNLPVISGSYREGKVMDQFSDEMSNGRISDLDSSKLTYFADISSDDHSNRSGGIVDSPPDIGERYAALGEIKRSRKIAIVPPDSVINEIRQRHNQPSNIKDASKTNSSDDDDRKNSKSTRKDSSISTRRKCKKNVKSAPRPINLNNSDVENEEKRPSPCKRKNSENMTETAGKFRKRSVSANNSESGEKTCLEVRSRSLSTGLKNIEGASIRNSPTKYSVPQKSRKRTNSDCTIESRVKIRRPPNSSDGAENK